MAKDMSLIWQMAVAGTAGAMTEFSNMVKALKNTEDSTKNLVEAQKKLENLDKVSRSYGEATKKYAEASKQLSKLKEEYEKTGKGNAEFAKRVKEAEKHVDKLNKQKERQKHIFQAARSELEKEGMKLEGYKKQLASVNEELKKQEELKKNLSKAQAVSDFGDSLSEKGSQQIKSGLAIGAALAVPIKFYMDVEESQADLRKILGKEAEKYYDDLAEISKNSPLSQIEVNEIAGSLAQSGIKGDDIVSYTDMAGKMKVAFDITTDEAGEFLAKTKEQLNLSKDELFSYMDTMNMLSNNYSVTAAQLADVSSRTGGFAKGIGLAKEANMAFATSLISANVNAEQTSTVLGKLYSELSQGANTKNKAAALDFLGLDSRTINEEMARDAEGTILKVLEKIKNANVADKSAIISDIFGSDKSVINGLSVLSENLDGVREKLSKAKQEVSENERVNGEYEDRINTLSNQLKMLRNNLFNALADVGKSIAPELKDTFESLKKFAISIANFIKENPKLVASIVKILAGIAMFKLGMGGANKLFSPFVKGFALISKFNAFRLKGGWLFGLKKMFPLTSKLLGGLKSIASFVGKGLIRGFMGFVKVIKMVGLAFKSAFLTNPIGLIILAIVAVIAIFVVLYKKCEWFRNAVNKIWAGMKTFFIGLWTVVKGIFIGVFSAIKAYISTWIEGVKQVISGIVGVFTGIWNIIKGIFTGNFDLIKKGFSGLIEGIKNIFGGFFKIFTAPWEAVKALFSSSWSFIKDGFTSMIDGIKNIFGGLIDIVSNTWNKIKGLFSDTQEKTEQVKAGAEKSKQAAPKVAQNWTGTNYFSGGLTTLAERGPELVEMNNNSYLAGAETLANLPRGSKILNNSQTKKTLSGRVSKLSERVRNLADNSSVTIGGNTYIININGADRDKEDIAKLVRKELENIQSKQRRTAIV